MAATAPKAHYFAEKLDTSLDSNATLTHSHKHTHMTPNTMQHKTIEQERYGYTQAFATYHALVEQFPAELARIQFDKLQDLRSELARVKAKVKAHEVLDAGEASFLARHAA